MASSGENLSNETDKGEAVTYPNTSNIADLKLVQSTIKEVVNEQISSKRKGSNEDKSLRNVKKMKSEETPDRACNNISSDVNTCIQPVNNTNHIKETISKNPHELKNPFQPQVMLERLDDSIFKLTASGLALKLGLECLKSEKFQRVVKSKRIMSEGSKSSYEFQKSTSKTSLSTAKSEESLSNYNINKNKSVIPSTHGNSSPKESYSPNIYAKTYKSRVRGKKPLSRSRSLDSVCDEENSERDVYLKNDEEPIDLRGSGNNLKDEKEKREKGFNQKCPLSGTRLEKMSEDCFVTSSVCYKKASKEIKSLVKPDFQKPVSDPEVSSTSNLPDEGINLEIKLSHESINTKVRFNSESSNEPTSSSSPSQTQDTEVPSTSKIVNSTKQKELLDTNSCIKLCTLCLKTLQQTMRKNRVKIVWVPDYFLHFVDEKSRFKSTKVSTNLVKIIDEGKSHLKVISLSSYTGREVMFSLSPNMKLVYLPPNQSVKTPNRTQILKHRSGRKMKELQKHGVEVSALKSASNSTKADVLSDNSRICVSESVSLLTHQTTCLTTPISHTANQNLHEDLPRCIPNMTPKVYSEPRQSSSIKEHNFTELSTNLNQNCIESSVARHSYKDKQIETSNTPPPLLRTSPLERLMPENHTPVPNLPDRTENVLRSQPAIENEERSKLFSASFDASPPSAQSLKENPPETLNSVSQPFLESHLATPGSCNDVSLEGTQTESSAMGLDKLPNTQECPKNSDRQAKLSDESLNYPCFKSLKPEKAKELDVNSLRNMIRKRKEPGVDDSSTKRAKNSENMNSNLSDGTLTSATLLASSIRNNEGSLYDCEHNNFLFDYSKFCAPSSSQDGKEETADQLPINCLLKVLSKNVPVMAEPPETLDGFEFEPHPSKRLCTESEEVASKRPRVRPNVLEDSSRKSSRSKDPDEGKTTQPKDVRCITLSDSTLLGLSVNSEAPSSHIVYVMEGSKNRSLTFISTKESIDSILLVIHPSAKPKSPSQKILATSCKEERSSLLKALTKGTILEPVNPLPQDSSKKHTPCSKDLSENCENNMDPENNSTFGLPNAAVYNPPF